MYLLDIFTIYLYVIYHYIRTNKYTAKVDTVGILEITFEKNVRKDNI